ncbi:unnamed protein product [Calicophoron daubneyi]|uniref:Mediator of RNA polymerase II transcription subunit 13 n=1 Tax=Calicophoron daubneyi TaxID=300641 RepID=A0AAV2TKU7_CALDB
MPTLPACSPVDRVNGCADIQRHLGFPHQLACCGPFHHNDVNVKQIRTTSLTAVDCRDHPKSPSTFTTAFLLAHDPSMPTLSPQQPASASGSLMPSVSWARQESSSGDSTLRSDQLMCNNSVVPASVPPSLPAVSTPTTKLDSSVDGSFVNSCVGLPVGLVTVGQSPSTIHNSQYARMPSCFSPPLSITKRPPYNAWLIDRANQECSSALEPASKPPHLNLEVADECEREQAHSHKNDVVQYLISKQNLPVSSALDNCCLSGDETTAFYYKRIHLTCNGYSKDDPRCHSDEPIDQSGLLTSVGPDNLSPDVLFEAVGSEPLDDDLNSPTSGTELLQGISPTVTSCSNKNNVFGRSVGGLLHKGVSLASSTGSGHVGPAELALMLPTPPSHDAPQPSPVDIILPTGARPSACSTTTDSPTSVNHTSMEPLTLTADSGLLSSPMHHQPLSPLPTHHAQGLLQLAKQSCIFSSSLFSPHDVVQDWSFVCPCAAYLGMASEYQMACNDLTAFTKSLPQVSLAYDHRAVYSKPSLASGFNEVTDGAGATQYQYMPSPTKETCLKNQQKSWLLSPNCQSNSKSALAQNSQLEACLLDGDLHHPASNTLNTGGTNMSLLKSSVSGHLITPAQSRSEELSDRLVGLLKADGVLMNLMLSDSMLNLFKDHNFDSCNICECTSSVLGAEIDIYLSNPVVAPTSTVFKTPRANLGGSVGGFGTHDLVGGSGFVFSHGCKCGFSAVMNQRCAVNGNLFYEDEMEVTNLSLRLDRDLTRPTYSVIPMYRQPSGWWCGSSSASSAHLVILQQVLGSPYDEFSVRQLTEYLRRMNLPSFFSSIKENMLEYDDSCALVAAALFESAKASDSDGSTDERLIERPLDQRVIMHPAYILKAQWRIPENHNDQIRLLTTIRPWLQEAISSTRLLESNYTVDGPLTWRAFHQLAGRGPDETCKPQPIPQLRVAGSDKEHLLISPFAVRDWDRLSLVPLSRPKQIAYVVVVPWDSDECQADLSSLISNNVTESETTSARMSSRETGTRASVNARNHSFIQHSLARFFRELSHTYENCRLGQHSPYFQPELNCPETAFVSVRPCAEQSLDNCSLSPELFRSLMNQLQNRCHHPAVFLTRLQAYVSAASYCTVTSLRDHGVTVNTTAGTCSSHSRSITKLFPPFGSSASNNEKNDSKIKIRSQNMNPSKERGNSSTSPSNGEGPLTTSLDTSLWGTSNDTYVVIYLINPFSQLCDISSELHRLVMQAFIGCADKILTSLPDLWRPRVTIQFLSLDQIMCDYLPRLRSIALAVYSSVNRYIEPTLINANRTLTGIGPSAEKEVISLEKEGYHRRSIRAPAYTLIGPQDFVCQADTSPPDPLDRSSVLFVAYCLSQDQQWLLASFTDEQGGVLDQTLINIRVPSSFFTNLENHRPHTSSERTIVSPRRIGLARLWDYIINFLSRTSNPWRLVIGRVGRLGHGELKGWNGLLGRKSLQDVNRFLRERCLTCNASATTPASLTNVPSLNGGAKTTLNLINTSAGANSCTHELPSLISACLVSLEPQSTFRIYPGVRLCSDDAWACGGGGGAGGGGGPGSGSGGNLGGGSCGGAGSSSWGSSASPFMMRTMTLLGSAIAPNDVPSTTHILVFPTSTSASGLSEHDASALNEVISGISQEDMNVLEWLRSGNNELAELDAPDGATAAILGDLDNPTGLGFDLPGLGGGVGGIGVNDHVGLDDPHDNILSHSDYGAGLRDPRAHDRISDSTGLHGLGSSAVDLGTGLNSAGGGSQGLHFDEQAAAAGSEYLNTMPFGIHDRTDEVTNLMQQPLAMGYYISTAPTGPLPSWFWSSCPHSSLQYPVCLKSALHLQTSLVGVDDAAAAAVGAPPSATTPGSGGPGVAASEKPSHLLDSTSTCDVLRYVLEAYNALSWLTINPVTNDRRSCLPIHMLILCQLYHGLEAYT